MATITRAAWGAGPHRAGVIATPVPRLVLHHTVTPFWTGAAAARNLQQIARSRGFVDISYSWLGDRQGNEIEGRGWGRAGAHTLGYNTTAHALSLVGNLDVSAVPDGMIRGAVRVVRRHRRYGPSRLTHGHRDLAPADRPTACPGRWAYARIAAINAAASGTPTPPQGGTVSLTANEVRTIVREELDAERSARHVKEFGRNWIRDNVLPVIEEIRDQVADGGQVHEWAKEAAWGIRSDPAKPRSGNYTGRDVDRILALLDEIKSAVTGQG